MMIGMNETASSTAEETRIGRPSATNATSASNATTCQSPIPDSARASVSDTVPTTAATQDATRIAPNPLNRCPKEWSRLDIPSKGVYDLPHSGYIDGNGVDRMTAKTW